jgi:hypothetical protein
MWSDFFVFCQESVTAQERYGKYEDEDKHAEQSKLNHAGPEDARPGGGPRSFFGECGSFQGDYENAPYGGDQADDKKRFGDERVRVYGNTNGVENFHQHQHDKQMIEDLQCLVGDGPVTQSLPKHLGGIGDRGEGSGK